MLVVESIAPAYGTTTLLLIAAAAVALLLFLIMQVKLHAFVSLVLVSVLTALVAGIPIGTSRTPCCTASPTPSAPSRCWWASG